ncbi:MAG TPA: efflux transporter outer membrane subunit [Anaeromyxobacteraceae bacterium]|nr:efflux transporter outer membrane subunit [Anaeromyxobacteraceae bacterium]
MITQRRERSTIAWLAASLVSAIPACVVGPKYEAPAPRAPPSFKEAVEEDGTAWNRAEPADAARRGAWWAVYHLPELDALERELNINNETVKQYFQNFMAARALIGQARAQYFPTVSVGASYSRLGSGGGGAAVGSSGGTFTGTGGGAISLFSIPVDISWAPDLWGKVRNAVRQAQYSAQVSAADLESELLTEQASLAQYYFEIRGQDALQKVLDETVTADKESLEFMRAQYATGIGNEISVVEAENVLQAAQAAAVSLAVARAQYEHAIATLIGKPASEFSLLVDPRVPPPPHVPAGVPSQLLERRPDVAAAERTMAAANAQIGIAYAAYFPSLTLSVTGGLQSSNLSRLFDWPSRFWSVGASISETVFDAGLRGATVRQFVAAYNADLAAYRQTVLTAFQQVEDGLAAERLLAKQAEFQQKAVESAQKYLRLEQGRYATGVDSYVNVVIAQNAVLSARQAVILVQTQQLTASVQLIEALGGGWDRSQLPSPDQVSQKPTAEQSRLQR